MVCSEKHVLASSISAGRSTVARNRAAIARAMLADCDFCAHHCGVNRLEGQLGLCRATADTRF
ncbi:MAG TPA: hypothetical protein VGV18_02400, partial [Verrucomicrobiae bacterium]|nr:hypothetical protein [Verrucomicrobiae bacterium]